MFHSFWFLVKDKECGRYGLNAKTNNVGINEGLEEKIAGDRE